MPGELAHSDRRTRYDDVANGFKRAAPSRPQLLESSDLVMSCGGTCLLYRIPTCSRLDKEDWMSRLAAPHDEWLHTVLRPLIEWDTPRQPTQARPVGLGNPCDTYRRSERARCLWKMMSQSAELIWRHV